MNLKDRGITIGDLLLILIFIISTFFIIDKVKDNNKESYFHKTPNEIMTPKKS